jgi:hypothetical protein
MRHVLMVVAMLGMVAGIASSAPRTGGEVTEVTEVTDSATAAAAELEEPGLAGAADPEPAAESPEEALVCDDIRCTQVCIRRGFCDGFCNSFGSCQCVDPGC